MVQFNSGWQAIVTMSAIILSTGGVFLGLNGTVIKSHVAADATGVAAAITLAHQLSGAGFVDRLAARVASAGLSRQDADLSGPEAKASE